MIYCLETGTADLHKTMSGCPLKTDHALCIDAKNIQFMLILRGDFREKQCVSDFSGLGLV